MMSQSPTWLERAARSLRSLAERPATLFFLLLALNAAARPYAHFAHDARLYSAQVLNQLEAGSLADDLFFRYGSQDQFSLFSRLAAPLVALFGLEASFFGLYLVFNGLFLWAMQRLVQRLVDDSALSTLALIFLSVAPLSFGGLNVFHVHEPFLTPRIIANALTLFGLERLLAGRPWTALGLLVGAAVMHPLMALGGLLIWVGFVAWEQLPTSLFWTLLGLGLGAATAVLASPPLALKLFGGMDEEWRAAVRHASAYNFPDEWGWRDWWIAGISIWVVFLAGWLRSGQGDRRGYFLLVVAACGVLGLAGTVIGSLTPYALLFQGQPYRVLWILRLLHIPLGMWLIARGWRRGDLMGWLGGTALTLTFYMTGDFWFELVFPLFYFPVVMLGYRGLETNPRRADWLARSTFVSFVLGAITWGLYKIWIILQNRETILPLMDSMDFARILVDNLGPVALTCLGVWLAMLSCPIVQPSQTARLRLQACLILLLLGFVVVQAVHFAIPLLPVYRQQATRHGADLEFVQRFFQERLPNQKTRPTVYSALGRIDFLWVDLHAQSYFDWAQIVGCLFNRNTALEGQRRARVVSPFEIDRIQEQVDKIQESRRRTIVTLYDRPLDAPPPTRQDLERLCREPGIDFAILKQGFDGLDAANNGRLFIYDCRQVRASLRIADPAATQITGKIGPPAAKSQAMFAAVTAPPLSGAP